MIFLQPVSGGGVRGDEKKGTLLWNDVPASRGGGGGGERALAFTRYLYFNYAFLTILPFEYTNYMPVVNQ